MRWPGRTAFNLSVFLSLALCAATAVAWALAATGKSARVGVRLSDGRYALRADGDRIRLIGPPPRGGNARQESRARGIAGNIRNNQLGWQVYADSKDGRLIPGAVVH